MATRRPDQRTRQPVPYVPGSRAGAQVDTINLDKSGLALDTTVQQLNAIMGAPSQNGTLTTLLQQVVNAGAQPFVPNLRASNKVGVGSGVFTLITFGQASRIWRAGISFSAATNNLYSSGITSLNAVMKTGGGVTLAVVEIAVGGPSQASQGGDSAQIPGMPVEAGDTVTIDVNDGVSVAQLVMRCSCTVLFSVP